MIPAQQYHEWNRWQWASLTGTDSSPEPTEAHWNKFGLVADRGAATTRSVRRPEEMPEGESALSGFRHNPGVQHWASARARRGDTSGRQDPGR